MKVYIRASRTVEQLETQDGNGLPKPLIKQLIQLDPTSDYDNGKGGKYCPWIIRMHKSGSLKKEDYRNLADALEQFAKDFRKYPVQDINQYKSVEDFLNDTHEVGNRELTDKEKKKMLKKQAHSAADEDKKLLVEDGDWQVWTPLTYAGSISLARWGGEKASWCTAYEGNDSWYRSYTSKSPLYIFINTKNPGEKYQTNFGRGPGDESWFYDIHDREQGKEAFLNFCAAHPKIGKFFEVKSENGVLYRAGVPMQYDPKATTITLSDEVTKMPSFTIPAACKEFILPDTITDIPAGVFKGSHVETVVANNINRIGANAFRDSAITNIDLSTVHQIGSSAFRGCKNITTLDLNTTDDISIGSYAFADTPITNITILPTMSLIMASFDECHDLVVDWQAEDSDFEFSEIKLLKVDPDKCPTLFNTNKGWVDIQTPDGTIYEATSEK